jgi:undecaprenyl-diphosphatase
MIWNHHMRDDLESPTTRQPILGRWWVLLALWLAMFLVALPLDAPIATWVQQSGTAHAVRGKWFAEAVKFAGTYWFVLVVVVLGLLARRLRPRDSLFILLASAASGSDALVKWIVGRTRPFKLPEPGQPMPFALQPFWHGLYGLFHEKNLSFASGHECLAFALATAIVLIRPRWGIVFGVLAALVGIERVLENAHYLSDVIGGIGVGALGTLIVWHFMKRWLSEPATSLESTPVQP